MKKCKKIYVSGYNHGISDAYYDIKNKKYKNIEKKLDKQFISKLYDIGYINGYNKLSVVLKNNL